MAKHDLNGWPAISRHVWETKYRWSAEAGVSDTWDRVARAVASVEPGAREEWACRFRGLLEGFRFLPGGRILAGAGTGRRVTLFNCFVMGSVHDSLDGIFEALRQGALTMQSGGGIGCDFSTLRPRGARVASTGSIASGPVSFMRIWDAMCATMLSTGARRGAMMATLRCDHPDIEQFINAKREPAALRHFNLSVQVTDAFMDAVRGDRDWPLLFPVERRVPAGRSVRTIWSGDVTERECEILAVLPARALWNTLTRAAYDSAEPGVLFVDQINRENNLYYLERITTTNPCGEIPLPAWGACNLGSLNLPAFVIEPFEPGARLDFEAIESATRLAVRFMDNVIDLSIFPVPEQAANAHATRRLGLGLTGLGDALAMLGQRYDGWTARGLAEDVMRRMCLAAYGASTELAAERGAFPAWQREAFLGGRFVTRLPSALRDRIGRQGMRNSHLLAVAPAGTISLLAGNVSGGIEPIFALEGERRVLDASGSYQTHPVQDFAWNLWRSRYPREPAPDSLVTAHDIDPRSQLEMQAAVQPWVDNAISKTINVPPATTFEDFQGLYGFAHSLGLKGCTVFRPSGQRGEVLAAAPGGVRAHCCDPDREAD